jgi:transcriptional/translational regulatory protein YebC/TACO1
MFEAALEAGADNVESDQDGHDVTCAPDTLNIVREALEAKFGAPSSARLDWRPQVSTPVTEEQTAQTLLKLLDVLEDNDDIQRVHANFDISQDLMEKLSA